jgi:hypothetical protein
MFSGAELLVSILTLAISTRLTGCSVQHMCCMAQYAYLIVLCYTMCFLGDVPYSTMCLLGVLCPQKIRTVLSWQCAVRYDVPSWRTVLLNSKAQQAHMVSLISTAAAKVDLEQRGQSAIIGYRAVKAVC